MSGVNIFSRLLESGIPARDVQVALSTTEVADRQVATQTNHDNLNMNANMQISDGDVTVNNPVHTAGIETEDAAVSGNVMLVGGRYDSSDRTLDNGDAGAIALTDSGAVKVSFDAAASQQVTGMAAEDAAASGNPVLVAGRYDNSARSLDDGDAGAIALTSEGAVLVSLTTPIDSGASLTVDGTVTANLSATDNAVLDTIETNTDSLTVTGGGVEATALRVTLASDSTGVLSIDDNGGSITVDGEVTANLSATDNAVLDTIETNTDSLTVTGGGTETGALRVTLASDSTGVLSIDDNGGSITVDGEVTANLSATDNAVLDTIETNTDSLTVTGGGVEASALRVTLASDSTGVLSIDDNGGSITVDGTVTVEQATHGSLQCNATMQIADSGRVELQPGANRWCRDGKRSGFWQSGAHWRSLRQL